jgi:hypothetical protein
MTMRLFRNRWYRIYFELLDSFGSPRCPLCYLIRKNEQAMLTTLLVSRRQGMRRRTLKTLCVLHKARVKETFGDDLSFFDTLKTAIRVALREVAHPHQGPRLAWSRWFRSSRGECPLCRQVLSEEKALCRALIQFLDDTDFWKGLQRAPLLCLDHLEKCLAIAGKGRGFERLLDDQSAKLNELLDDLVRFEATGTNEECKTTALRWLADFVEPSVNAGEPDVSSGESGMMTEPFSGVQAGEFAASNPDQEGLLFENEKLRRKNQDLIDRLNEVESRAASLHYRVAELSDVNKRLEMGYTGASAQANGLKELVQDLRAEIERLGGGNTESRAKAVS